MPIAASSGWAMNQPAMAMITDRPMKKVALVPTTRRACAMSRAPIACPIRMVEAMPKPNTEPIRKNMMLLAFAVAVSAASPRKRPTQTIHRTVQRLRDVACQDRQGKQQEIAADRAGGQVKRRFGHGVVIESREAHTSTKPVCGMWQCINDCR